jgi:protoporphyrinogen/coproporphyrinogen III oxidase
MSGPPQTNNVRVCRHMKLVVVVGGGLAGLAAAHRVVEWSRERGRAVELSLLEAADRLGGTIHTERREGFVIEHGPDSFLSEKPWALDLCRRLGVEDRLLRTDDRFRRTFVVLGGRLHPLPDGFQLLAPTRLWPFLGSRLFSWPGKLRMALDLALPRGGDPDESLGGFVRRRLGREALERVAQPLVAGIYTADPEDLSLAAAMPRFLELERRERSVILGMWRAARRAPAEAAGASGARWSLFVSFGDGMDELVRLLAARLPPGAVRLRKPVSDVRRNGGRWQVSTAEGGTWEADALILAPEAHRVARMVRYLDPALAHLLDGISYASSATVTLAYRRADVAHPLDGFGFVVPHVERRPIIACTFSSVKYPGRAPHGHALLRVFLGGALAEAVLEQSDDSLVATARSQLDELLGTRGNPVFTRIARYPKAMPQYHVGHLARVEAIEQCVRRHPGLALVGGAYRGVGIADCVRSGEEAAERLLEPLARSGN